ncbi:MAG: D-aminoacyl-tRNA deacylase [Candidatus Omnitrophica bacterium]|nr:D-aminoacyl-tRNA deacylase [Candidatus Omnitrophota bacterium]
MKIVAQRVNSASVKIKGETIAGIQKGLVLLTGISHSDTDKDIDIAADKICNLRIFEDDKGKINLSVRDVNGELLVVSQFTLLADLDKGRRPSFTRAASPDKAESIYNQFIASLRNKGIKVECGKFREYMQLELVNDGPATFIFETDRD